MIAVLRASLATVACCALVQAAQPSAPAPVAAPLRELQWGQLNFLHTTDTHGWHAGHLQQSSYSADWGDYISFATHMHNLADAEGFDLLLVDTGDRIEGNGLYDASDPKGKYTSDIFKHQHIDIICSGNHELYKANSSENERKYTVPNFQGNYLASNLDIRNEKTGELEPLASRSKKFTTKNQGIRITAFGFLYNFQGNANNTFVRPVEEAIKEQWFQDAIRDRETDLFLVTGHVAADSEEYKAIYTAIRQQQYDIPIQFFAGHTHIRDFKQYDKKATAMESGRYMETIGFLSLDGVNAGGKGGAAAAKAAPKVRRRYIDNNLFSLHHHSLTNDSTFDTELGRNVTKQIAQARKELNLDHRYGCAPKDLWIDRVGIEHDNSMFKWLSEEMLPDTVKRHNNDTSPKLILTNTGAMRFDIFQGNFTIDATFLVSPFTSGLRHIMDVDYEYAQKLLKTLNNDAPVLEAMDPALDPDIFLPPEHISPRITEDLLSSRLELRDVQKPLDDGPRIIPGYTTRDDLGDDGDDTLHSPLPFVRVQNCVQSEVDFPSDKGSVDKVDLIYNEFIEPWILLALQFLGSDQKKEDTAPFVTGSINAGDTMTNLISMWVQKHWKCDEGD